MPKPIKRSRSLPVQQARRTCGECTACCIAFEIEDLQKPVGERCRHATDSDGCARYASRPETCRAFECQWLRGVGTDDERPDLVGYVTLIREGVPGAAAGNAVIGCARQLPRDSVVAVHELRIGAGQAYAESLGARLPVFLFGPDGVLVSAHAPEQWALAAAAGA